jgi:BON domain
MMNRLFFAFGILGLATSLAAGQTSSNTPHQTSPAQQTPGGDMENNAAGSITPGQHPTTTTPTTANPNPTTPDPTAPTTAQPAPPPQAQQPKGQSPTVPQGEAPLPSTNVSDSASLQQQLKQAYESEPSLNGSSIDVAVTDSQVELTGTVPTNKDKINADRIAKSYAGSRKVVDKVSVAGTADSSGQKH